MICETFDFDLDLVLEKAKEYDEGIKTSETQICKLLLMAYDRGFDDGVNEAETVHMNTQLLLMHTGGSC